MLVSLNGHITVVLPDRDVPLGVLAPGQTIAVWRDGSSYGAGLRDDRALAAATSPRGPGAM